MSVTLTADRRKAGRTSKTGYEALPRRTGPEGPSVAELAAGAQPTGEQMGSRVDLPGEIREKMENSFGADFSSVRLYESETVADAGADAVTQGSSIAFAPGKLDLTSTAGQALLGHELSHVVSQARDESAGQGFLNDPHLEAQADRQGMMAARGESVYSGPVSPIGASSTASAAGPMQAKKHEEKADIQMERQGMKGSAGDLGYFARRKLAKAYDAEEKRRKSLNMPISGDTTKNIPEIMTRENAKTPEELRLAGDMEVLMRNGMYKQAQLRMITNAANDDKSEKTPEEAAFSQWLDDEFEFNKEGPKEKYDKNLNIVSNRGVETGVSIERSGMYLWERGKKAGMKDDEIKQMLQDLALNKKKDAKGSEEEKSRTDAALMKMKGLFYGGLKDARDKYGTMMTQLHPEDALNQAKDFWDDTHMTQDCMLLFERAPELFDPNSAEDREFGDLTQYFMSAQSVMDQYAGYADALPRGTTTVGGKYSQENMMRHSLGVAKMHEANVLAHNAKNTPHMGEKELRAYRRRAKNKYGNMGLRNFFENEDESVDTAALREGDELTGDSLGRIVTIEDTRRELQ